MPLVPNDLESGHRSDAAGSLSEDSVAVQQGDRHEILDLDFLCADHRLSADRTDLDRKDGECATRPLRDLEHVAFRFDPDPETTEHRKGHRLSDRLPVAPMHLFGLSIWVERVVHHLCCADHLQFCNRILIHRGAPRQLGRQGLRLVPFDGRHAGSAAGAVPDLGLGHGVFAFKPVGHDERSHLGHHPALSWWRDMARVGETDACLNRGTSKISKAVKKLETRNSCIWLNKKALRNLNSQSFLFV